MENDSIYVAKSSMPTFDEYIGEIKDMWETRWLSNRGEKHRQFEEELKEYLDTPHVALFANGHLALEMVLEVLHLHGEVITTPYTHASTAHAIVRNGLTPVFCDINLDDLTINAAQIEELITEHTVAIVATHVYGYLCDVYEIERIARKHGLKVIYDAAHAFGVKLHRTNCANFGDASMFSLHATKVFHTIEGGLITYGDKELFHEMDYLINFGFTSPEEVEYVGSNTRMNEFEAAMGICNLKHHNDEVHKRKAAALRYQERLDGVKGIRLLKEQEGVEHNYSYFPIIADGFMDSRNELADRLAKENIYARKYFYPLIQDMKCYRGKYDSGLTPVARHTADCVLTLPLYADLNGEQVDRICDAILRRQP